MKCSAESALSYPHHRQLVSYLSESVAAIEAARSVLGGSWDQLDKTRRLNLVLKQGHQLLKSLASVRETTTPIVPLSPKSKSEDVHDGVNPRVALAAAAAGSLPIEILLRIMSFQSPSTTATISSSSLSSFEIYRQHQCDLAASFSLVNFKWAVAARSLLFTAPHLSSFSECLLFSQGIRLMKKYSVQRNIPDWQIQKTIKSFQFSPCSTLSPTRSSLGDEEEDSNSYFLQTLNSYASNLVCLDIRDLGNFTVTAKTLNSIFSSHPHITRFSVWRLDVDVNSRFIDETVSSGMSRLRHFEWIGSAEQNTVLRLFEKCPLNLLETTLITRSHASNEELLIRLADMSSSLKSITFWTFPHVIRMQRQSIAAFFQNLTHLNLVSCHADDEMIETICLHAKKNLYALRIQEGLVTDQGLAMIAEAYGESQHFSSSSASSFLRILVLTDIHTITTRGCVAMLEKIGPQLFSLGLASTRASTEIDCQLIDALIQYCTSLLTLDVSVPLSDPIIINHQFSSNKQKQILETFVKTMVSRLKWIRLMGWAGDGSFMKRFGDLVIRGHHCLDDSIE